MSEPIDRAAAIREMWASGRTELIHYAGAAHRDRVAWHVVRAWLDDRTRTESECRSMALSAAGYGEVTPAQLRAIHPEML